MPLALLRYTCLPQGFTNSVAEFQNCMTFILQDEIFHIVGIMIDNIGIKGPKTQYKDEEGIYKMIPENPGIQHFIWEHANNINRILHRLAHHESPMTFFIKFSNFLRHYNYPLFPLTHFKNALFNNWKTSMFKTTS